MSISIRMRKLIFWLGIYPTTLWLMSMGCIVADAADSTLQSPPQDEIEEIEETEIAGVLLARVDLSPTHGVEFWQFDDGSINMREIGTLDDVYDMIDFDALAMLSPIERFAKLAGPDVPAPDALVAAAEASTQQRSVIPIDVGFAPPPVREDESTVREEANAPGKTAPGQGLPLDFDDEHTFAIDWNADAQWWQSNFCSMNTVDSVWCPTNVSWANAGSSWAMFYETSCLAASFNQSAFHRIRWWNGSSWVVLASATLAPRYWQKWWVETTGWYTANCESINTGGDSRIHFAYRRRWATPSTQSLADHPFDREYHNALSDDINGVTHDSNSWYACNANATLSGTYSYIWKTPVGTNLDQNPNPYYSNPWQGVYNHFGDIGYGAGYVFVPLEGAGGSGHWGGVGVLAPSLSYYGWAYWPWAGESDQDTFSPWVAYNPKDGLLYSSKFDTDYINKYGWSITYNNGWQVNLSFVGRIRLRDAYGNPVSLTRVQGGEFSNTGKLYLSSDSFGGNYPAGIYVLDVYNGRIQTHIPVQIDQGSGEELEGITLWDLSNGAAPNIGGQIHVQLLDNDGLDTGDLYFKHVGTSEPLKL